MKFIKTILLLITILLVTQVSMAVDGDPILEPNAGDVVGPASSTDNVVARFDGITGKLLQNSANGPVVLDTGFTGLGGITTPEALLDVSAIPALVNQSGGIRLGNTTGTMDWNLFVKTDADGVDRFSIGSGATEVMTFDSVTKRVGINVSIDPVSLLEVRGTTGGIATLSTSDTTVVATDTVGTLNFQAPLEASGVYGIVPIASISAVAEETFDDNDNQSALVFKIANDAATPTERMRVSSAGNVGIGTMSPSSPLHVVGNAYFSANVSALTFTDRTPFYEGDALSEIALIKGKDGEIDHDTLPAFSHVINRRTDKTVSYGPKIKVDKKDAFEEIEVIEQEASPESTKFELVGDEVVEKITLAKEEKKKLKKQLKPGVKFDESTGEFYTQDETVTEEIIETPGRNIGASVSMNVVAIQQLNELVKSQQEQINTLTATVSALDARLKKLEPKTLIE